jgi:hypothetical protein
MSEPSTQIGPCHSMINGSFACSLQREIFLEFFARRLHKRCAVFFGMVINDVPLVRAQLAGKFQVAPCG